MPSILFVCTANRFRSPLASLYFAREVVRHGDDQDFRVASAGTWTRPGEPAMARAIRIAEEHDLNLSYHKSRLINGEMLSQADLILVMDSGHKESLTHEFPSINPRTFLLTEAVGAPSTDIADPYTTDASASHVAEEILKIIDQGYQKIITLAREKAEERNKGGS